MLHVHSPPIISATVSTHFFENQTTIVGHLNRAFCNIPMFLVEPEANLSIYFFENQATIPVRQCTDLYDRP